MFQKVVLMNSLYVMKKHLETQLRIQPKRAFHDIT